MKKELTEFEKISGYLLVLEEQQEVVTGLLTAAGKNQGTVADIIMRFESAISLAIGELKQKLAELDHIEEQKVHMKQVLSELKEIECRIAHSIDASAAQFRELARTVPAEIEQNILTTIQQTDIVGAVRQRMDAQMEAIAIHVDNLSITVKGFIGDIQTAKNDYQSAKNDLEEKYYKLTNYFWWIFAGNILAVLVVIALSVKLFFGSAIDNNYNTVFATYKKVEQLEGKLNLIKTDYEKLKNRK
ncbi:hypothetical protein [Xenorhabdus sp. PB62.4]|uniref:hypothetical protein n=1 Tax=Xenorhabdus sp. PB62.4 TaxID=1851573 RepID=UPI0016569BF5|nr:hypothetical protein [Xenorhabdus sp. PB62.4]MBC8953619.1 hypothetical protein [Xenorhabdus sp. PB62.4]